jgi:hypothetical protein
MDTHNQQLANFQLSSSIVILHTITSSRNFPALTSSPSLTAKTSTREMNFQHYTAVLKASVTPQSRT